MDPDNKWEEPPTKWWQNVLICLMIVLACAEVVDIGHWVAEKIYMYKVFCSEPAVLKIFPDAEMPDFDFGDGTDTYKQELELTPL